MTELRIAWQGIAVEVEGPADLLASLDREVAPFLKGSGNVVERVRVNVVSGQPHLVSADIPADLGVPAMPRDEGLRAIVSRVELLLVSHVRRFVTLHAGVVMIDGKLVVLPGRSRAGKSTLVQALVDAGGTYWSDEFAPVDASGAVHPYPRRLTLRQLSGGTVRELPYRHASADDEPVLPDLVALLQYDEAGWSVEPVSPGRLALGLIENCVAVRRAPAQSLDVLSGLSSRVAGVGGTRGSASEAVRQIRTLLS